MEVKGWLWLLMFMLALSSSHAEHDLVASERPFLLLSTLNGSLVAVDKSTGQELWTLDEDPILQMQSGSLYDLNFFPNPKDGTVYALGKNEHLERLPLTIPRLVEASPIQSSDGLLYAGRKLDSWLAVDMVTGDKLRSFTSDGVSETCPVTPSKGSILHLARTAFTLAIYDRKTHVKRWNVTYMEYSSNSFREPAATDLLHFCSNSDGSVLSVDRLTGKPAWQHEYGSPVMAVYSVEQGRLRKVPSTSVAANSLDLSESTILAIITQTSGGIKATDSPLQRSLFVGSYEGQTYAVNSLVRESDLKLEFTKPNLIEGPDQESPGAEVGGAHDNDNTVVGSDRGNAPMVEEGHFCLPEDGNMDFEPGPGHVQDWFLLLMKYGIDPLNNPLNTKSPEPIAILPSTVGEGTNAATSSSETVKSEGSGTPSVTVGNIQAIVIPVVTIICSAVLATVIAVTVTRILNNKSMEHSTSGSTHSFQHSPNSSPNNSVSSSSNGTSNKPVGTHAEVATPPVDGVVTVGKITYYTNEVLGHGSEGTMVFKGTFDERPVAVKRLLPECFGFADREVDLLRQSDKHSNVVRYYCMEQDSAFRYIALELGQATLYDYVTSSHKFQHSKEEQSIGLLEQAMKGLSYLHSIGIVHRDIKPHNVLLSFPSASGAVRAMISDFGLCKKLPQGKVSYTARSGLTGTEGWVAPEVLDKSRRVTFAVDIFSMGCVIYYILTKGCHPFGPSFRRQANIEMDECDLSDLSGLNEYTAADLLKNMISHNSNFRPTSEEVLCHCLFWSEKKQLAFFQDVSDRIEKEHSSSPVCQALELNAPSVCGGDWKNLISDELQEDLRKYRSYQGSSVRDLLRAMRNKKHHYRELPEELKRSLGRIPDEFVRYFTGRFPSLLIHTYKKMEICKRERIFKPYYSADFRE